MLLDAHNRPLERGLRWHERLRLWYKTRDLYPENQLFMLRGGRQAAYESTGEDPFFRLRKILPAGWYMAEVELRLSKGTDNARFYLDFGGGESESHAYGLPLRNGQVAKRLLYLPAPARLRFDPIASPGSFALQHFRVVRMPQKRALDRLARKLATHVPRYKDLKPAQLVPHQAWLDYNALFEPAHAGGLDYACWIAEVEAQQIPSTTEQQQHIQAWTYKPLVSVILPTWNTNETLLRACLDSVLTQTYPHWELCIADDASTQAHVRAVLSEYASRDPRIHVTYRPHNGHISAASNTALEMSCGEFVALLDHDDLLAPHALFFMVQALQAMPQAQILYSDEDKLSPTGQRCEPFFKPDWSPDQLYAQNYISHLGMYRRALLRAVNGFRLGFEGSQDYDLLLRCVERIKDPQHIVHIPQVLYHWRQVDGSTANDHQAKSYAEEAAHKALQEHMARMRTGVTMEVIKPGIYRARWPLPETLPLVSLIVPTRDGHEVLSQCLSSILEKTDYPRYEILVIDNQSSCAQTLAYLQQLPRLSGGRVRVIPFDQPFNYSAINNMAARHAKGSILGLINNDVEVINPDWLREMVSHAIRPDIGCVGAKLYYPDGSIQHAGVVLGLGGVAGHSHKYSPGADPGYFHKLVTIHNVSAVTAAALLVRKSTFEEVGGLDEEGFTVAFNDVDFCLKVREAGYRNLWTPYAELVHHESKTRGADSTPAKQARFAKECELMRKRWGPQLDLDPFYNLNLTTAQENYSLSACNRHTSTPEKLS